MKYKKRLILKSNRVYIEQPKSNRYLTIIRSTNLLSLMLLQKVRMSDSKENKCRFDAKTAKPTFRFHMLFAHYGWTIYFLGSQRN